MAARCTERKGARHGFQDDHHSQPCSRYFPEESYVNFVWADDPTKRLGLEVPFGLPLDQIETAAREAVDALAQELSGATIVKP